jgi:uncharacterized protein HemY
MRRVLLALIVVIVAVGVALWSYWDGLASEVLIDDSCLAGPIESCTPNP